MDVFFPKAGLDFQSFPFSSVYSPLAGICVYLVTIFGLREFMRHRPPMKLKWIAFAHNVFLCALSVAMCVGISAELVRHAREKGPMSIICDRDNTAMKGRLGLWLYIFYASKYYELFDTVVMVLKKRPLNFLHVYHHSVVMPVFWVFMQHSMIIHWILSVANSGVHVIMYYYYACATVGVSIWWKKYITMVQIIQFVIDLTATWPFPFLYYSASGCSGSMRGWFFGQAVGISFFKLFSDFYRKSYKGKGKGAVGMGAGGKDDGEIRPVEKAKDV